MKKWRLVATVVESEGCLLCSTNLERVLDDATTLLLLIIIIVDWDVERKNVSGRVMVCLGGGKFDGVCSPVRKKIQIYSPSQPSLKQQLSNPAHFLSKFL